MEKNLTIEKLINKKKVDFTSIRSALSVTVYNSLMGNKKKFSLTQEEFELLKAYGKAQGLF